MDLPLERYDLVVIGSGPAGEKGAAQAAYFGRRVALVEKQPVLSGAGVNTGAGAGTGGTGCVCPAI